MSARIASSWTAAAALLGAVGLAMVALGCGLPERTFYVGDPGVKLMAARNAIARPDRPFEIALPDVAGDPVPWVDPFFIVHGNHSHAVTSELFPLLSAPFIARLGLRGAYVLPAAGLLLALAATAWVAVLLDSRRSPAGVVLTTFLATPLLFYGLEFWEHALAAGIAALAMAVFVSSRGRRRAFGSGVLFGVAALLRPEALWFAIAVLACSPLRSPRPPRAAIALAVGGIAAAFVPFELYALAHFGGLIPPHIAGNPALVSGDWTAIRAAVFTSWFLSRGSASFWHVAPAILLAFLPVSRMHGAFSSASSAVAQITGRRFLLAVAVLDIALVVLTAPNDGGSQWGPRYLLLAYLPLAIIAADSVQRSLVGSGFSRIVAIAVIGVALGSAWIQRSAYEELRGAKLTYARIVGFVAREAPPGRYIVTDLWWLDQSAASLADSRRFLFVSSPTAAADALHRLSQAGERVVTVIRSSTDSSGTFEPWLQGACYSPVGEGMKAEGLVATELARSATCLRQ